MDKFLKCDSNAFYRLNYAQDQFDSLSLILKCIEERNKKVLDARTKIATNLTMVLYILSIHLDSLTQQFLQSGTFGNQFCKY